MNSNPKASRTTPEDDAPGTETSPGSSRTSEDPKATERAERAARAKERSTSTERVRRYRERKRAQTETAETPSTEATDAEVYESGAVFALIYDLALVPVTGGRLGPLQADQTERAGRVLAPLVKKYAPLLGEYSTEIAAVLVLGSIFRSNWREPPTPVEVEHAETE